MVRLEGCKGSVGVFDSGVGGISVLKALVRELPGEDFAFYGDSAHNPYGEKRPEEVLALSQDIVGGLLDSGCKAVVIACNTATSAAAARLREDYPKTPIIGVEPALKPAALSQPNGRVLVLATPLTVRLDKFQRLLRTWEGESHVIAVPCEGLAARIERGDLHAPDLYELLERLVGPYAGSVDAVVLGCTHYPFVREQLEQILGDVPFFDSADGTARQLRRRLAQSHLLSERTSGGKVRFFSSSQDDPAELELYRSFFELA
ncbi:MAG: glutamate racemase [Coriobacteriales bacterium]|nr:glutamate racemase [Coriobacteriales bacterium]